MLPSPHLLRWLMALRTSSRGGEPAPHKPVLLLAVLELADTGRLPANQVVFSPLLAEYFGECWKAVSDEPVGKMHYPFWHLDTEPFWSLEMAPGFEERRVSKRYSPSTKQVREWVQFARLDPELFDAFQDATLRDRLRGALVAAYFPHRRERPEQIRSFEQSVFRYGQLIRHAGEPGVAYDAFPKPVRDAAFRRTVTEAYDYTCAVSGVRLTMTSGGYYLVQAAHIRDWADSYDDSPQNGLALSANHHWLFERGLFTIDEGWRVRVSPAAKDCIGSVDELLTRYGGQTILLPAQQTLRPAQAYLQWHRENKYLTR